MSETTSETTFAPQAAAPLFELGQLFTTPGVINSPLCERVPGVLRRHQSGDWGDMCLDDKRANNDALRNGDARIFSAYKFPEGKLWVITEWDRSSTTILLPDEY